MFGSWIFNVWFGLGSFVFYFLLSILNKSITRSLIEAIIVGFVFFFLGYIFRWALYFMNQNQKESQSEDLNVLETSELDENKSEFIGKNHTADSNELNDEDIDKTTQYIKEMIKD
ncbi:hypothetical protein ACFYKX_00545 [Cytobacillus sp. FJAT-54145]|uniref:Uncharacterized protein n=1 Tax=Cytobacillus spartinae TaxID=3299023 RepID=A0ABW6K4J2_9BACI